VAKEKERSGFIPRSRQLM